MLTLNDYLTSSGKYPERLNSPELTNEVKANAKKLIDAVNLLLAELKIDKVEVSSGFRPSSVNSIIPNSAKKSLHMTGLAIDLKDSGDIKKAIVANIQLLDSHNLWLESPDSTVGWCHLDLGTRSKRPKRIFVP